MKHTILERMMTYPIDFVLQQPKIVGMSHSTININGEDITIRHIDLFRRCGTTCMKCGVKGVFFAKEREKKLRGSKFHLTLYAITKDGREVSLTKDHVVPKSKGGQNTKDNYQVLCFHCNGRKSDGEE